MKIHRIIEGTYVNGPGFRLGVWVQGCIRNCPGCFNKDACEATGGFYMSVMEILELLKDIQGKIKYFNPSVNDSVLALDRKIANSLGDLKIEINKAKGKDDYSKAIEIAKDIQISLIVERTAKANSKK